MNYVKLFIYSFILLAIAFVIIKIVKKNVHDQRTLDKIFIIGALTTLLLHYSSMFVDFANGNYYIEDNMFLPVYPCNVMMWINVLLCFLIIKKGPLFSTFSTISFYLGTGCGLIGLCFNKNFLNNPFLNDYDILKGLLSHAAMIFTSYYLGAFNYVRIKTFSNLKDLIIGMIILALCSAVSDKILVAIGREAVNGMLLTPLSDYPIANFYMISLAALIVFIVVTSIYEGIVYKDNAWYKTIARKDNDA